MADASTLRVAWDDSSDPAVVGYKVSMGSRSGVYTVVVDAGRQTFERFDDLTAGARYYFVVQAYDAAGNLSAPSVEVSAIAPSSGPITIVCPVPIPRTSRGEPVAIPLQPTVSGGIAPVATTCSPPSGSLFPIGVTSVTCAAIDALGAVATCDTTVIVVPPLRGRAAPCADCSRER
jgi:hypothetical protein